MKGKENMGIRKYRTWIYTQQRFLIEQENSNLKNKQTTQKWKRKSDIRFAKKGAKFPKQIYHAILISCPLLLRLDCRRIKASSGSNLGFPLRMSSSAAVNCLVDSRVNRSSAQSSHGHSSHTKSDGSSKLPRLPNKVMPANDQHYMLIRWCHLTENSSSPSLAASIKYGMILLFHNLMNHSLESCNPMGHDMNRRGPTLTSDEFAVSMNCNIIKDGTHACS